MACLQAQSKGAGKVVGVDIDDTLVRAAWKRRRYVWSMQEPQKTADGGRDAPAGPKKRKRTSESTDSSATIEPQLSRPDYFPASCEHTFGPLPIPPASHGNSKQQEMFPHNVTFRTADWVNQEILEDSEGYDIVLALVYSSAYARELCSCLHWWPASRYQSGSISMAETRASHASSDACTQS